MKIPDYHVKSPSFKPWDIDCSNDPVLTKQEFAKDCDVNEIISRCVRSQMPLPSDVAAPLFADVSEIGSFDDCLRRVTVANASFMQLPANIRNRFNNDVGSLLDFLADTANVPEAIRIGLIEAPKPFEPAVPAPVSPTK